MLQLMEYDLWIKRTEAGLNKPRSRELKKIDEKLKAHHLTGGDALLKKRLPMLSRNEVGKALQEWKDSKGATWKNSVRNINGAVEDLTKQINDNFELSDLDKHALRFLADHRRQHITELFKGRQVKLSSKLYTANETISAAYQTYSATSSAINLAKNLVHLILGEAVNDPAMASIIKDVLGKSVSEFIAQVAPGVGLAYSSSMATYNSYLALSAAKSANSIKNSGDGLLPGDPTAAFLAVQELIKRESKACAAHAGSHAIEATAKAAGIFLDAGAVTGTASSLIGMTSRLLVTLHLLKKDWDEMRSVKKLLQNPSEIDNTIFTKAPLLGCYFLVSADTWVIVNLLCCDFGKPGYKYKVEQAVDKHIEPLLKVAGQCIVNHRMTLTGVVPKLTVKRDDEWLQLALRSSKVSDKVSRDVFNFFYNITHWKQPDLQGQFK